MAAEEVTQWITRLADGDQQAAARLWEAYFDKLVQFAAAEDDRPALPGG